MAGKKRASRVLSDLRWVYDNPNAEAGSESQKRWQGMYKENFTKFMELMTKHETAHRGAGKAAKTGGVTGEQGDGYDPEKDEGTERAMELIDRLLKEARDGIA